MKKARFSLQATSSEPFLLMKQKQICNKRSTIRIHSGIGIPTTCLYNFDRWRLWFCCSVVACSLWILHMCMWAYSFLILVLWRGALCTFKFGKHFRVALLTIVIIWPRREKKRLCCMQKTNVQTSLRIHTVWSAPLLFAHFKVYLKKGLQSTFHQSRS